MTLFFAWHYCLSNSALIFYIVNILLLSIIVSFLIQLFIVSFFINQLLKKQKKIIRIFKNVNDHFKSSNIWKPTSPIQIAALSSWNMQLLKPLGSLFRTTCPGSSNPREVSAASLQTPKTIKSSSCPVGWCLCESLQWLKQCGAGLLFMLASWRLASTRLNGFLRQLGIFMASFDWMVFGVETEGSPDEKAATIHCRCWSFNTGGGGLAWLLKGLCS